MNRHFITCFFVLAALVTSCSSNSDYRENGSFAITSVGSTTLTPGGSTTISTKYTTTVRYLELAGNDTNFSSNRPDLVIFNSATVKSDSTGSASNGLSIISTAQVPTGGVDVLVTVSFRGLSDNKIIHVNPGTSGSTSTLTPSATTITPDNFLTLTAKISPALADKSISFSYEVAPGATYSDLIKFIPETKITDINGIASTSAWINPSMTIPPGGVNVIFAATADKTVLAYTSVRINPSTTSISLTPSATTITSGSNFTVTAKLSSALAGKIISFASDRSDLIKFVPETEITDGTGTATTVASVNTAIPASVANITFTATDGLFTDRKIVPIKSSTTSDSAIKLTMPALVNLGSSFAVSALLSPAAAGDKITFTSSSSSVVSFNPVTVTTDGSGTAKSVATVKSTTIPQNGLDVTVTATDGTIGDLQVIHVNGAAQATFTIFPVSLDISNATPGILKPIQIVSNTPGSYNFSAASRSPFIIDVDSVNNTTGVITIKTAPVVKECSYSDGVTIINRTVHTGIVTIEIKDNKAGISGPTLYYPVTYSLCW